MDHLIQLRRRESATTSPALDMSPSTSAAMNVSPLRWQSLDVLERKGAFIDQLATNAVEGRGGGAMAKKCICIERTMVFYR